MDFMTTQPEPGGVPELTLGWRLQMALARARMDNGKPMTAQDMGDYLEVHRITVGRWMKDEGSRPKTIYIKQWAVRCGVSYTWLSTGQEPAPSPDPNGGISPAQSIFGPGVMIPCSRQGQTWAIPLINRRTLALPVAA